MPLHIRSLLPDKCRLSVHHPTMLSLTHHSAPHLTPITGTRPTSSMPAARRSAASSGAVPPKGIHSVPSPPPPPSLPQALTCTPTRPRCSTSLQYKSSTVSVFALLQWCAASWYAPPGSGFLLSVEGRCVLSRLGAAGIALHVVLAVTACPSCCSS